MNFEENELYYVFKDNLKNNFNCRYSKKKYTIFEAYESFKTLRNCYNCINCTDCINCKNCVYTAGFFCFNSSTRTEFTLNVTTLLSATQASGS